MKKLKLNLDEIKVESFETNSIQSKLGTVVGQISGNYPTCDNSCLASYCGTCYGETCNKTCWIDL